MTRRVLIKSFENKINYAEIPELNYLIQSHNNDFKSRFSTDHKQRCKQKKGKTVYKSKGTGIQSSKKEHHQPKFAPNELKALQNTLLRSGIEISKFDWLSNIYSLNYSSPCRHKWNKRRFGDDVNRQWDN
jgi:hypothetical protein